MRYISAEIVYPISSPPIKNGIVIVDVGKIVDVVNPAATEISSDIIIEKFDGFLCPGFVNSHCHLELSHLKGRMEMNKGLTGFIGEIVSKREADEQIVLDAINNAEQEMYESGTVVVGDISNSEITIRRKKISKIYFHTFIELFDLVPERAGNVFADGLRLQKMFVNENLTATLTPHAPYTVSLALLELISEHSRLSNSLLSIHNQETESENEMFESGSGKLLDKLQKMIPAFNWSAKNKSSIQYESELLHDSKTQFVHNTFTRENDLSSINNMNAYWCLCLRANLFIENKIPDVMLLSKDGRKLTIGTDSYASNHSLSMIDEIKTIQNKFPSIALEEILKWATLNGAEFLGVDRQFGSFEKGKQPGIVCIDKELNSAKRIL